MPSPHSPEKIKKLMKARRALENSKDIYMPTWTTPSTCGTIGCMAGTVCMAAGVTKKRMSKDGKRELHRQDLSNPCYLKAKKERPDIDFGWWGQTAAQLMDLSREEADALFGPGNWPLEFMNQYDDAQTPEERKQATIDRLDYFIKTGM